LVGACKRGWTAVVLALDELMAGSANYFAELVRGAIVEGVDIVFPTDDFAYNEWLFVEPTRFMRLWPPHADRIFEPARGDKRAETNGGLSSP
jgi:hypothetical protein